MGKRESGSVVFIVGLMGLVTMTIGAPMFQSAGSGLVLHLRMEELAGTTANDLSGIVPPNNGTWNGGVTSVTGTPPLMGAASARCTEYNGTNAYVSVPHNAGLTLPGDFTAALWVYKNAENGDWVRLFGKGASGVRTFGIWEEPGGPPAVAAPAGQHILFQRYGAAAYQVMSAGSVPLTTWTHLAVRVQSNVATIFFNGVADPNTATQTQPAGQDTEAVTIGAGVLPGLHSYWNGRIDDVRLYNRALSNAEIAAIAAGTQGPVAPTGLVAVAGNGQVSLSWTNLAGIFYNVKRSTTPGGPYTAVGQGISGGSYVDTTVTNGTTYYYVVSGVTYGEGADSTEVSATPMLPVVTALPNTGLFTSENLATTTFNVVVNRVVPAGTTIDITVTSNASAEGQVSTVAAPAASVNFQVVGPQAIGHTTIITVTGVDDFLVDGPRPYTVTVTTSSADATFNALTIPPVNLTNNDNDTPGITFSRVGGLGTDESGGTDTFSVTLNTQPFGFIDLPLSSSNTAEMTVSPATLRFTPSGNTVYNPATGVGDYNVAHIVTVTGVDDTVLDFTMPFTVITGALQLSNASDNPAYSFDPTDVTGINLDNETIPTLPAVWGGGSGGGCGLLGLELAAPFLLLGLWRRRRIA
jgi:hypothetical protein